MRINAQYFLTRACILALAYPAAAQTAPTFRTTTRLVEVSVIASDKNGPVDGLKKEDFVLFDNGRRQNIAVFEKVSRRAPRNAVPATAAAPAANEFTNRPVAGLEDRGNAVIVVWDTLNTGFGDQIRARSAVLKTLRAIRPGDHVGVYILGSSMSVLQDFTSDSGQLAATLEKHTAWPDIGFVMPERKKELMQQAAWQIRSHMAHLTGRKSVIWISAAAPFYLSGADFNVYVVDARGIPGFPEIRAELSQPSEVAAFSWGPATGEFMKQVAASTGGVAFTYGNDIRSAIDRAMTDADLTYTLAFYPSNLETGGQAYHKLKVEIRRRGVSAHYRQQYQTNPYEPPPAQRAANAIVSPIDLAQIAISAHPAKKGASMLVQVTIGAADIVLEGNAGHRTGAVDVIAVERAPDGAELARVVRSFAVDVEAQKYDALLQEGIRVTLELDPKPGLSEVKIVAIDRSSGRVGSLTLPAMR